MATHETHGTEFHLLKEQAWDAFYREKTEDRLHILFWESWPFLFFLVGVWTYSFLTPYAARIVAQFEIAAHAQTPAPLAWANGKAEWILMLSVAFHLALLAVFLFCVIHMLYAKQKNSWAGKTATYILGFLTKALAGFIPG